MEARLAWELLRGPTAPKRRGENRPPRQRSRSSLPQKRRETAAACVRPAQANRASTHARRRWARLRDWIGSIPLPLHQAAPACGFHSLNPISTECNRILGAFAGCHLAARSDLLRQPDRCRSSPLRTNLIGVIAGTPPRPIFRAGARGDELMNDIRNGGAFPLGDRVVKRLGYGAMQLAGPGVFGPPKDRDTAIAVLR